MPIQVPKIQRFETQAPQSVGRISVNATNPDEANAINRKAIGGVLSAGAEAYSDYTEVVAKKEQQGRELKATELQNSYELKYRDALAKIDQVKGDTTELYKKLDEDSIQWKSELSKNVGEDPDLGMLFQEKIARSNGRLNERRTLQQTKQQYTYQADVVKQTVQLRRDDAVSASELVDLNNPGTMVPLMSSIDAIEKTLAAQGEMNGFPIKRYKDPESGKDIVEYAPAVENQIKDQIGATVNPIVKTLNAAGKAKEAKAIMEQYDRWLSAEDKAKLSTNNQAAQVKNAALAAISELKTTGTDAFDEIDARTDLTDQEKDKAKSLINIDESRRAQAQKRKANVVAGKLMTEIQTQQASEDRYTSVADFKERNQFFKENEELLSVPQRKQIESLIAGPPRVSDEKTLEEAYEAVEDGSIAEWDSSKLLEIKAKLNRGDAGKFERIFMAQNGPKTDSQRNAFINNQLKSLSNKVGGMMNEDNEPLFPKDQQGKFLNPNDAAIVNGIKTQITDYIEANPNASDAQIKQQREEYISEALTKKKESGGILRSFRNRFMGGRKPVAPATTTTNTPQQRPAAAGGNAQTTTKSTATLPAANTMKAWTPNQWREAFKKENPKMENPTGAQVRAFKNKKLAGK